MSKEIRATIYHKDIPTVTFFMNENGKCSKVLSIENSRHVPIGINGSALSVNRWLRERSLNLKRHDVIRIMDLGIVDEENFIPLHFLSPTDSYFVKYSGENMPYNAINLYDNDYKIDVFSLDEDTEELTRDSGNLAQSRDYEVFSVPPSEDEGRKLLFEEGMNDDSVYLQEMYADEIPVLDGRYAELKEKLYYEVDNITNKDMEYIPFKDYLDMFWENPINAGFTKEEAFFTMLKEYDFPDYEEVIPRILFLDDKYDIDRTLYDIGVLRNPDTLEIKAIAPLFNYKKKVSK